jgi:hypothetical protein
MDRFHAVPLSRADAQAFIAAHHRHHEPSIGDVFRVALALDDEVIAVAMVGRPVARMLNDGLTAEVTRLCVVQRSDAKHAASALYARCWRIAREMGYRRLLTYTLRDETGVSLVAAGWRVVHQVKGRSWDTPSRRRTDKHPTTDKTLWEISA